MPKIVELARELTERVREGWRSVEPERRRRWLTWLAAGYVLSGLFCVAVTILTRELVLDGLFFGERPWLNWLAQSSPLSLPFVLYWGVLGDPLYQMTLVTIVAVVLAWNRRTFDALGVLLARFATEPLVGVGYLVWDRPRPQFLHEGMFTPYMHSFPSGHTVEAVVAYGFLCALWLKAGRSWVDWLVGLLVWLFYLGMTMWTRMVLGTHWPSDMLFSVPYGLVWLGFLVWTNGMVSRR